MKERIFAYTSKRTIMLKSPWKWVPSLYLYQGIPYSIVTITSGLMYKNMGISNASFTFWTSLLYLPWTLKPLWSPYVEVTSTKRQWVISTQILIAIAFILAGISFQSNMFYLFSIILLAIISFCSASHDIACDGFYMLALNKHDQSFFVGVRTTFYRIAMLAALGLVPQVAGYVQEHTGDAPCKFSINANHELNAESSSNYTVAAADCCNDTLLVSITSTNNDICNITAKGSDDIGLAKSHTGRLDFTERQSLEIPIVVNAKSSGNEATTFTISNGNIALSWTIALAVLGGVLLLLALWNSFGMPKHIETQGLVQSPNIKIYIDVFKSFISKPKVVPALTFFLLYRLGEAQLSKIVTPFLIDYRANGGLGMSPSQYGWAYGTVGMICLTIGGIAGGFAAAKYGLKKVIWSMIALMNLPNIVFVLLAHYQPATDSLYIYAAIAAEQLGYGFGFTAYMLFILHYVGDSQYKTAEYAIATTIMALGMMLPGMISGYMNDILGYEHFFIYVLICCIPGIVIVPFLNIDNNYGKKVV